MLNLIKRYRQLNWAMADQVVVSGSNFVTGLLVARFIGVEQFGQFTLAWVLLEFIFSFQNSLIISPMMSIAPKYSDAEMPSYFSAVMVHQLGFVALSFLVFLIGSVIAVAFYPEWYDLLVPIAAVLIVGQTQNFLRRYLFTRSKPEAALLNDVVRYLGQVVVLIVLFQLVEMNSAKSLWVQAGTSAAAVVLGVFFVGNLEWNAPFVLTALRRNWDFAKWLLSSEIMRWGTTNLFIVLAGAILGAGAVGIIRATQQLVGVCHIIQLGLENIVPVRAAHHFREGQRPALVAYVKRVALFGGALIGCVVVVAAAAPELWLNLVYGPQYEGNGDLVRWWSIIYFIGFMTLPFAIGLRTVERTAVIFRAHLTSTIFTLIAAYPLIHYLGVLGVMIGILIITTIRIPVMYRGFRKAMT